MSTCTRTPPRGVGAAFEPGLEVGLDVGASRRVDEEAEAVAAAHHRERRLGRAEHADLVRPRLGAAEGVGVALRRGAVGA